MRYVNLKTDACPPYCWIEVDMLYHKMLCKLTVPRLIFSKKCLFLQQFLCETIVGWVLSLRGKANGPSSLKVCPWGCRERVLVGYPASGVATANGHCCGVTGQPGHTSGESKKVGTCRILEFKVSAGSQMWPGETGQGVKDKKAFHHPLRLGSSSGALSPGMEDQQVTAATCCKVVGVAMWKELFPASHDLLNSRTSSHLNNFHPSPTWGPAGTWILSDYDVTLPNWFTCYELNSLY